MSNIPNTKRDAMGFRTMEYLEGYHYTKTNKKMWQGMYADYTRRETAIVVRFARTTIDVSDLGSLI